MFDPRTLCTPALFFHPWSHTAAALLLRAPLPKGLVTRMPAGCLPSAVLENAAAAPSANPHFLLLEDDSPRTLFELMTAWEQGPPHRHLAFWIPRRHAVESTWRTAARLLNGMLVPDDPELVSGWLTDHLKRPATWAEIRAVLNFFQGLPADESVLASSDVAQFFADHGGRAPARAQFIRIQHQCLQALVLHHRDALLEKNLAVVAYARRESLLADRAGRQMWAQLAQALQCAVVPVSAVDDAGDPSRRAYRVHAPLGAARADGEPAWITEADVVWRRVNPPKKSAP